MEELTSMGIISIIPAILAIVLSFTTKNTIAALAMACITGTVLIGILVAYFQKAGAIQGFSQWVHDRHLTRRGLS